MFVWDKMETEDGVQETYLFLEGSIVGSLRRERETTWGRRGLVLDNKSRWIYTCEVYDSPVIIGRGLSLREVKKIMIAQAEKISETL